MKLAVNKTWNGIAIGPDEAVSMEAIIHGDDLVVTVEAPYHADPAPVAKAGYTDGLWEYEVAELFILGSDRRYLELEMGPHGHYLALSLHGPRNRVGRPRAKRYGSSRNAGRWKAKLSISTEYLPMNTRAINAFAIHGQGAERRYLAAHPVPGDEPDFHRLECFAPIDW